MIFLRDEKQWSRIAQSLHPADISSGENNK
jgi:hypothetical protein